MTTTITINKMKKGIKLKVKSDIQEIMITAILHNNDQQKMKQYFDNKSKLFTDYDRPNLEFFKLQNQTYMIDRVYSDQEIFRFCNQIKNVIEGWRLAY